MLKKLTGYGLFVFMALNQRAVASDDLSWKTYPYTSDETEIVFPNDEGRHRPLPELEWWYLVFHVTGVNSGEHYSILVTHFNNLFRFFTISNIDKKIHTSGTALGPIKASSSHLDVVQTTPFGKDYLRNKEGKGGELIPFEYEMETHHSQMHLRASLTALKPPMIAPKGGYVPVGKSGHSWYYSLSRLAVTGELSHAGKTEAFTGIAWMDHQWGPFLISPVEAGGLFETYEWFCVQLDNGDDIMISNIYNRDYQIPITRNGSYGGVSYFDASANIFRTADRDFTRTDYWQDPKTKHYMSMGWILDVPEWGMNLTMTPDMHDQIVDFPLNGGFWEGSISVSGTVNGEVVQGKSFGELIHRFKIPQLELQGLQTRQRVGDSIELSWQVKNPDQGNPLHYSVEIQNSVNENREMLIDNLKQNNFAVKLTPVLIRTLGSPQKVKIIVTAYSVDKTIKGFQASPPIKLTN